MADNQKFCTSCGQPIAAGARFCASCGAPVDGAAAGKGAPAQPSGPAPKLALRDILIVAGVLVLVTAGYLIFARPGQPPAPPQSQAQAQMQGQMPGQIADDPHAGTDMAGAMANMQLPTDYNSLVQLGNQTMDSMNFPVAAECYRRALEIDSTSPEVRIDFGACLHSMGLPERALEEFRKVLNMVLFNLGIVFSDLGPVDSAKVYFNKYLTAAPNGRAADRARELLKQIGG